MKLFSVLAIVCVTAAAGVTAAGQQTVELRPKWKKGDRLQFELLKSRERSESGKPVIKGGARTPFEIEVLEATPDSFALAWTWGQTTISGLPQSATATAQKLANLTSGFRMILDLNASGKFQGVRNWEEMRDVTSKAVAALSTELKAAGADQQAIDAIRAMGTMFASKEQVNLLAAREPQLFLMVMGAELELGKAVETEQQLPNPLGGEPFPTRVRVVLTTLDKGSGIASVNFQQTVDPNAARRIIENTLRAVGERIGKPAPAGELLKMLNVEDTAQFEIDTSTGWVQRMKHSRLVKSEAGTQVETIAIARTKGDT